MNETQFKILDALYFPESFEKIVEEVGESKAIVANELKQLLAWNWVQAYIFDPIHQDYVPTFIVDGDNLEPYFCSATKEGLLHHVGYR
ncbi:MAG: hypothetical protein RML72_00785 [Bacteroidia bacterium]|nr:hypothetical protein [Bacteroidia bacterium]MDW8157400.1 hypothetical protein [Bacteroidia bacterium]